MSTRNIIVALFTLTLLCQPFGLSAKQTGKGNQAEPGYRVMAKHCNVEVGDDMSLDVTNGSGRKSSVKIQYMKKLPKTVVLDESGVSTDTKGLVYLAADTLIPVLRMEGAIGSVYTQANIGAILTSNTLSKLSTKDALVSYIEAKSLDFVKMTALADSSDDAFATTSILTSGTAGLKVHLTGIVLETLVTSQEVLSLKVQTKKYKSKGSSKTVVDAPPTSKTPKGVSLSGIGRITPMALIDDEGVYVVIANGIKGASTKGASVAPDVMESRKLISKIQAKSSKFSGTEVGGFLGHEDDETTQTVVIAPNMEVIYAQRGINANLVAGAEADGTPDYSGSIKKIGTKPKTGSLKGEAHVAPGTEIKFTPEKGDDFVVHEEEPVIVP